MAELHEDWAGIVKLKCGACDEDNTIFESKSITLRLEEECRIPCPACNGTGYRKPEPQEVDDWLAVNVMGWIGGCIRWDWAPLTDANHALRLVAGIKDVNMSFAGAFEPAHHWLVEVYGGRVNAQARSFCEALCLAAAKATAEARKYE